MRSPLARVLAVVTTLALGSACQPRHVSTGAYWNEDLQCWDGEHHPRVRYVGDIDVLRVDDEGRCWVISSSEVPRGWEDPPASVDDVCPEGGLDGGPTCYYLLGYEP